MKKPLSAPDPNREAKLKAFDRLLTIMDELRENCPWDKKQTIHTLRQLSIEELYELTDAITEEDWKGIKEELGDLMLHLLFYAKIGTEQNKFTLQEVLDGVAEKLIARHPHIYASAANNGELVIVNDCSTDQTAAAIRRLFESSLQQVLALQFDNLVGGFDEAVVVG